MKNELISVYHDITKLYYKLDFNCYQKRDTFIPYKEAEDIILSIKICVDILKQENNFHQKLLKRINSRIADYRNDCNTDAQKVADIYEYDIKPLIEHLAKEENNNEN